MKCHGPVLLWWMSGYSQSISLASASAPNSGSGSGKRWGLDARSGSATNRRARRGEAVSARTGAGPAGLHAANRGFMVGHDALWVFEASLSLVAAATGAAACRIALGRREDPPAAAVSRLAP